MLHKVIWSAALILLTVMPAYAQDTFEFGEIEQPVIDRLSESAAKGDRLAASVLYRRYLSNTATAEQQAQGLRYLEREAEAGSTEAQVRLARILQNGQFGARKDAERARQLLETAVQAGDLDAHGYLAALLTSGLVPLDSARAIRLLEAAMNAGDLDAALQLAGYYASGHHVEADLDKAVELYEIGVAAGNRGALIQLGDLYRSPALGDYPRARALFAEAHSQGDPKATRRLGEMLIAGQGGQADFHGGVALLESLAATGDASGLLTIADYYQRGIGTEADGRAAASYLSQAANLGSHDARVRLAKLQRDGAPNFPANAEVAYSSYLALAEAGDAGSRRVVAEMTALGEGTTANLELALSQLEEAAANGDASALTLAGDFYVRGVVTNQDAETALDYYARAAQAGHAGALMRAAELYRSGISGFEADLSTALTFYEQAVAAGNGSARRAMADIYLNGGPGLTADPQRAVALLEEGVEQGDRDAALQLAGLYSSGRPLPADFDLAMAAFDEAIALGHSGAALRKALAMMNSNFASDHAQEGVALLEEMASAGNQDAHLELARAKVAGVAEGASVDEGMTELTRLADSGHAGAVRALLQYYRDGARNRLEPDLAAAQAHIEKNAALFGPEGVMLESMYVRLKSPLSAADYAEVRSSIRALTPANGARLGLRLFDADKNGYVHVLQQELQERGYYQGTVNGSLTKSTISAINRLCADLNLTSDCNKGPLNRAVAQTLIGGLFGPRETP